MKNYEKIKQMDKDELSAFLCNLMCAECCDNRCPAIEYCKAGHTGMRMWLDAEEVEDEEE